MIAETEKLLKSCVKMFDELRFTYDLSEHSSSVARLSKKIETILKPAKSAPKKAAKKAPAKKKKSSWKDELIKAWKPLFDEYPTLTHLPVYSWGRYYKYECAGAPFDCEAGAGEHSFVDFICDISDNKVFDEELLEKIDEEKGKEIGDKIGYYSLNRSTMVREFGGDDDRGGLCLVIIKDKQGNFLLETYDCDSPE